MSISRTFGVLRSLLIGVAVFTLAAIAGMLLAGAGPAGRDISASNSPATGSVAAVTDRRPAHATGPATDRRAFARSMVYSGATGLVLSITGLALVGYRRRLW